MVRIIFKNKKATSRTTANRLGNVNFLGRPMPTKRITVKFKSYNSKHTAPAFGAFTTIPKVRSVSLFAPSMNKPAAAFWGDKDGDGVYNGFDCAPNNPRKQGPEHKKQPIGFPKDDDDFDDFEAERREWERQKERDEFDIPDERASSIIKKKGKMALIRHHYPDSPISELPSTWEIKDNTGKSYWHSGIAYRSSGATEEEERKNAMEKFAKFEDDDDYLSPKEREAVEEEFEKEKAAWKKARGERH